MPIEVPDTRAFADPPPRRRRAAKPAPVVEELAALRAGQRTAPEPDPTSAFRKPVRRRSAVAVAEPAAVETPPVPVAVQAAEGSSAFSRPVRRRPRTETAAVPDAVVPEVPAVVAEVPPVTEAPARAVVEERRGTEGVADQLAPVTDTVVVRLGGTRYAVAMDAVAEVGRPPHVTRVPGVPAWIAGVANWRGRIMPVLDLRVLLGAATPELGVAGRIMVLSRDGITLAFLAERVEGVVGLELDSLEPVLLTLSPTTASVLAGQLTHPDGPIALLDLEVVFGLRSALPRVRRAG